MRFKFLILGVFILTACSASGPAPSRVPTSTLAANPAEQNLVAPPPTTTPSQSTPTPSVVPTLQPSPQAAAPITAPGFPDVTAYTWQPIAEGLARPVGIGSPNDGSRRLFILEQIGLIRIIQDGALLTAPFLDIRDRVGSDSNEQGLLGLAFHPDYAKNGFFFVNYTGKNGDTVIARFQVDPANPNLASPASELALLNIDQPYPNHNGGSIAFGPDGYLYLGLGDGGSAGDPQNNAQSLNTLLGKILRIDVDQGDGYTTPDGNSFAQGQKSEIWAYGLRNPWRFSFDRLTGDLYIGDVGQNSWEEIDFLPAGYPAGANFGWKFLEGTHPYSDQPPPTDLQLIAPVAEYDHSQGCSVTGGVVYRGSQLPAWNGIYLFADYCSGNITGLFKDAQGGWQEQALFQNVGRVSTFGEDEQGEIYLADHAGRILRLESLNPAETSSSSLSPSAELNRYQLSLSLDYPQPTFQGKLQFSMTNQENVPLDRLYFRLIPNGGRSYGDGSLAVSSTLLNGKPVQTRLSQENTVLEVLLPAPLSPGERAAINFEFNGTVPKNYGVDQSGYGIYNLSNGVMALSGWYPILAVYDDTGWNLDLPSAIGDSIFSDAADYEVEVFAPKNLVLATSGTQQGRQDVGENYRYTFKTGPSRDFFLVMSPDFSVIDQRVADVLVNAYYLPGHAQAAHRALQVAIDSLKAYNQKFGAYPDPELDVVDAPMKNAAGVEFPGIVLIGSFLYDKPDRQFFEIAVAHEVAHQWWYSVVGNDVFEDPWLDEALTTFSSSLYFEAAGQESAAAAMSADWEATTADLIQAGLDAKITQPLDYFENSPYPDLYGAVVYLKGGLFFHKLRELIGDPAFFEALQNYYQDAQFKIAAPADLLTAFEKSSGRELDDFFQEWLYSVKSG